MKFLKKNQTIIFLSLLLLLALTSCTNEAERTRMRSGLDSLNVRNRTNQPFAPADVQPYTDFFDRHGTANDRVLAYYLMGRAYHEQGEAPMALQCYQQAAECADTTASDCDYAQLSRVYGQMATIYHEHRAIQMELTAQKTAEKIAWLAKDTLNALILHLNLTRSYYYLGNKDSALIISTETSQQFSDYGQQHLSAQALATALDIWLERKETEKARQGLSVFENNSGVIAANVEALAGYEFFYSLKGRYYENINRNDSALYYYYKLLHAPNINNTEEAFKRLMNVYDKLMKPDSVRKYAVLFTQANDSASLAQSSQEIIRMQAIYNYENHKQKAIEAKEETENYKRTLYILCLFIAIIGYFTYSSWNKHKKKYHEKLRQENKKYQEVYNTYLSKQKELELLLSDKKQLRAEMEAEISTLRQALQAYHQYDDLEAIWTKERNILESDIIKHFHKLAARAKQPSATEWECFFEETAKQTPAFQTEITKENINLTSQERRVCLLTRLHFIPSEICALLNISPQRLTNLRSGINGKLFQGKGAKQFDDNIRHMAL